MRRLTVEANGQRYAMEVEQHLENKTVRCVMLAGSDGLARGHDRHRHRTRHPGAGG